MPDIKKYKEVIIAVCVMIFATVYFIASFSIKGAGLTGVVGATTLPRFIAVLMFVLGVLQLLSSVKQIKITEVIKATESQKNAKESESVKSSQSINIKAVVLTLLIIIAYVALIKPLGYVISTIVFLIAMFIVLSQGRRRNYVVLTIIAVGVTVPVFYFFRNLLHLMLP